VGAGRGPGPLRNACIGSPASSHHCTTPKWLPNDRRFPRLRHPVDDAKAFGAAMQAAGEGLYADVNVTYVLDGDATAAGLEKAIDTVGANLPPN
jgi:hypothetical protein